MISRIRYKKEADGSFVSTETFIINGAKHNIRLSADKLSFSIGRIEGEERQGLMAIGTANTRHTLHRMIKKRLKEWGFSFKNERRNTPIKPKVVKILSDNNDLVEDISAILREANEQA